MAFSLNVFKFKKLHMHTQKGLGAKNSFNGDGKTKDDLKDFRHVVSFDITKLVLQTKE